MLPNLQDSLSGLLSSNETFRYDLILSFFFCRFRVLLSISRLYYVHSVILLSGITKFNMFFSCILITGLYIDLYDIVSVGVQWFYCQRVYIISPQDSYLTWLVHPLNDLAFMYNLIFNMFFSPHWSIHSLIPSCIMYWLQRRTSFNLVWVLIYISFRFFSTSFSWY